MILMPYHFILMQFHFLSLSNLISFRIKKRDDRFLHFSPSRLHSALNFDSSQVQIQKLVPQYLSYGPTDKIDSEKLLF